LAPLASIVPPELTTMPLTFSVPPLNVSTSAPAPIGTPLRISVVPLNSFTVIPASILSGTPKDAPETSSSVAPASGLMLVGMAPADDERAAFAVAGPRPSPLKDADPPRRDAAANGGAAGEDHECEASADGDPAEEGAGAQLAGGAAEKLQRLVVRIDADELD